ncbi:MULTISPECIES: hypothetical protein [unclassified Streptomyces]|uniref:hypothetical protein n=1 Tax=unclassified Streptomyces TaxID=2593676 RepID=UPI000A4C44AE|nr:MULTISPECIES: hypothetical protein [unclassified Streptomyces]
MPSRSSSSSPSPWPSPPLPSSPTSPSSPSFSSTPAPPSLSPARSSFPPPLRPPRPLGTEAPPTREVPSFDPVRVGGGRYRLQRLLQHRGRAVAAGLAVTAAALVAAGPRTGAEPHGTERDPGHRVAEPARPHPAVEVVTAPVRIADAATVRLLHSGDRVDVIAAEDPSAGAGVRVLARGARVTEVPEPVGAAESGALVVLSVPRPTAARLVGASATARLAVTLC